MTLGRNHVQFGLQVVIPHINIRILERVQLAAFVLVLVIHAIHNTSPQLNIRAVVDLDAGIIGKGVDVVAIMEWKAFAAVYLVVEAIKLALFIG